MLDCYDIGEFWDYLSEGIPMDGPEAAIEALLKSRGGRFADPDELFMRGY